MTIGDVAALTIALSPLWLIAIGVKRIGDQLVHVWSVLSRIEEWQRRGKR